MRMQLIWMAAATLLTISLCTCGVPYEVQHEPGDLLFGGGGRYAFHPRGQVLEEYGNRVDERNRVGDTELLLSVAVVLPPSAAGRMDTAGSGNVHMAVWMTETFLEGELDDGSWHRFSYVVDGRKKTLAVGDLTVPIEAKDRLIIVLSDDWEPQVFRDGDLDALPVAGDIVRALRREWSD